MVSVSQIKDCDRVYELTQLIENTFSYSFWLFAFLSFNKRDRIVCEDSFFFLTLCAFHCIIALVIASSAVLNTHVEKRYYCLVLNLMAKHF